MVKIRCALLAVCVIPLLFVGIVPAEDEAPTKQERPTPAARFDEMEKVVNHDPLTGELTKAEFIAAIKATNAQVAEHAAEFFGRIKKADRTKVTKEEFVTAVNRMMSTGRKKSGDQVTR